MRDEKFIIGVDLGGTKIASAVSTAGGEIIARDYTGTPSSAGPDAVIQAVLEAIRRILSQADIVITNVLGIGVGAAGISNPARGILITSPNLPGWHNVPLSERIEKEFGIATFLGNDANLAALGELHFGAGKGTRNLIYITVSTGIGGGFIIDSKLYTGACGAAGEVGHMTIDVNGPRCNCGRNGCWEALASGTALAREAKRCIEEGTTTSILTVSGGDIEQVTAQTISAAAYQGDSLAKELISQTGYYLGVGLANLVNLFNPELILIGGGLSQMGDMLIEPALKVVRERAFQAASEAVHIDLAKLGGDSGVLGAVALVLQGYQVLAIRSNLTQIQL